MRALKQPVTEDPHAICALLPLFNEKSSTLAMIKHGMNDKQLHISIHSKFQLPPLISLYLSWQSLYSGSGQKYMVSQYML